MTTTKKAENEGQLDALPRSRCQMVAQPSALSSTLSRFASECQSAYPANPTTTMTGIAKMTIADSAFIRAAEPTRNHGHGRRPRPRPATRPTGSQPCSAVPSSAVISSTCSCCGFDSACTSLAASASAGRLLDPHVAGHGGEVHDPDVAVTVTGDHGCTVAAGEHRVERVVEGGASVDGDQVLVRRAWIVSPRSWRSHGQAVGRSWSSSTITAWSPLPSARALTSAVFSDVAVVGCAARSRRPATG